MTIINTCTEGCQHSWPIELARMTDKVNVERWRCPTPHCKGKFKESRFLPTPR